MAWFEIDIYRKCVEVDLHDYSHRTAIAATREKIKEAYEHGFKYIRLIHGAVDISNKKDGGSIKFALRPNPAPVDGEWKEMPTYEYR